MGTESGVGRFRYRALGHRHIGRIRQLDGLTPNQLLGDDLDHVTSIRFGTKALSYWPYRFTSDCDADDLLRLFEDVRNRGRQFALMANFTHPWELQTGVAQEAIRRVRDAGAVVRCQTPLIRHVNDRSEVLPDSTMS